MTQCGSSEAPRVTAEASSSEFHEMGVATAKIMEMVRKYATPELAKILETRDGLREMDFRLKIAINDTTRHCRVKNK